MYRCSSRNFASWSLVHPINLFQPQPNKIIYLSWDCICERDVLGEIIYLSWDCICERDVLGEMFDRSSGFWNCCCCWLIVFQLIRLSMSHDPLPWTNHTERRGTENYFLDSGPLSKFYNSGWTKKENTKNNFLDWYYRIEERCTKIQGSQNSRVPKLKGPKIKRGSKFKQSNKGVRYDKSRTEIITDLVWIMSLVEIIQKQSSYRQTWMEWLIAISNSWVYLSP